MPQPRHPKLESKIKELKLRAKAINFSSVSADESINLVTRSANLDNRILEGYLFIWGNRNLNGEKLVKGCCAKSIRERGPGSNAKYEIKFLNQHKQDDPLSLFDQLVENDIGLYFKTKPLDDCTSADRVITQVRSKTLNNFSGGFDYVWDKIEYDDTDDSLVLLEIELYEGSVVTIPSDMKTFAVRSAKTIELLHDETDFFINSLPRGKQLEARNLFAKHKALIDFEPTGQPQQTKTLKQNSKPLIENAIDYNFLTTKFKEKNK